MPKIKAVIFDMDGLLIDSESVARVAWGKAANEFGYQLSDELFSTMLGITLPDLRKLLTTRFGTDFPFDLVRERRLVLGDEHIEKFGLQLKPGALACVEYLRAKNIAFGLATSTFREQAEKKLALAHFPYSFDAMVCGDEITQGKPAPEIFLTVAKKLAIEPGQCLVLEDSLAGIRAGRAAKMHTILIPDFKTASGELEELADEILNSLQEVPTYLER